MNKLMTLLVLCCIAAQAHASEAKLEKIAVNTDAQTIERGADALMSDCRTCHSLKYIKFRDLLVYGMDQKKVDEWRGEQAVEAPLISFMPDDSAMQAFGKVPPDLSLMTKARAGGASYVYSYLIGYYQTPEGTVGNHLFPETRMPDVLGISGATDPAQRAAVEGRARDVVSFLAWAADPHEQARHRLGYYVIGYLVVLTLMLYFVKRRIWARLK